MLVVVTTTAALNGGDAAILEAQCVTIRQAFGDARIVVFDQQADVASRYYPGVDFRPALVWPRPGPRRSGASRAEWTLRLARLLGASVALRLGRRRLARRLCPTASDFEDLMLYRSADLIMTNGGTMLVEQYNFVPRLVDYTCALVLGARLLFFTQSLGPFTRPFLRRWLAAILRRASLVLVRGRESWTHVRALGVPESLLRVAPDPAFVLAAEERITVAPEQSETGGGPKIAISVREWPFFHHAPAALGQSRYEAAVADLCIYLVRTRAATITFVSTCQGIDEYWVDDSRVAERIVGRLPADVAEGVAINRGFHPPSALRRVLGTFDVVVATRLHAAILAMTAGTPALGVAYERKSYEVFDALGLADSVVDIEELDGTVLIDAADRLLAGLAQRRLDLLTAVRHQSAGALAVADFLRDAASASRTGSSPPP
ncbi:MAG: polysaccharide pyruvyl transferase family protein [Actinomycetota bacterium]|nr:polysaccharide pyruvyl transferase family protein [Actinomycetota bacterium]